MSGSLPINQFDPTAPTPQNTPLTQAPIALGLSRPTVPDISEEHEEGMDDEAAVVADAMTSGVMQGALAGLVQNRLNDLIGKSSGYIESLPVEVKRSVAGLQGIQVKQTELQNQFKREVWELEKKYLGLTKPLYERRHAIISGSEKATAEEIAAGEEQAKKDDEEHQPLPTGTEVAPITDFWLTALQNHIGISELITDRDTAALKNLTDVRLEYLTSGDQPGFKLLFVFSPNEFFENEVLEKTYLYHAEIDYSGDFTYERAIGTDIKWKDDKDLTKEIEIKKQRNKNTNRTRLVKKATPTESFFNFFNPPQPPPEDMEDEDELADLEARLELDYQIGEDIKERIIPHAVDYFTGKALEYDAEDMDDDDEDDDEDDDDAFEDDDDVCTVSFLR
ncbi:NAP-domain-containing protein [Schizopora paradoxa]|uniref:NAP-domain-containing protein n=1 Tax=Schizopora paradoxa TaxID=27342 RepID=A0A0H2RW55_9AGAM|nr:NAP-domain-containing protein [Schizopora paradoxa]